MKFICPSCKAKYQIADEKVAGRSVRMKCRKCSHVIHIGAPGTAAQMDRADSLPPRPRLSEAQALAAAAPELRQAAAQQALPRTFGASEVSRRPVAGHLSDATAARPRQPQGAGAPVQRAVARGGGPVSPAKKASGVAARPVVAQAPKRQQPGTAVPRVQALSPKSAPRAAETSGRVNRVSQLGAAPAAGRVSRFGAAPTTEQGASQHGVAPAVRQRVSEVSAAPAVGERTSQVGAAHQVPNPVHATASIARPQAGAASPPTPAAAPAGAGPVARPHRASEPGVQVPVDYYDDDEEATHILQPGALADAFARVASASPDAAARTPASVEEWFVGIDGSPVGPLRLAELGARAAMGAINGDSLVWRDGFDDWQPLRKFPELAAIVEDSRMEKAAGGSASSSAPPVAVTQGHAAPASAIVVEQEALEEAAGLRRRRSPSRAAWVAVAIGPLFGLTLGFVWFGGRKPAETVVKYVEVPAQAADRQASSTPDEAASAEVAAEPQAKPTTLRRKNAAKSTEAAPAPQGEPNTGGLEGLKGLKALSGTGPKSGPGSTASQHGGQPLDSSKVQATVGRYTPSVKRSCWNPALDTRDSNAPSSARVTVTISVAASGSVTGVSTSGDPPGYRGLANCIAARVRGWTFPASDAATMVNVPFVFAAQ